MVRYGMKKGGKLETYMGLTGVGDLIVTMFFGSFKKFSSWC